MYRQLRLISQCIERLQLAELPAACSMPLLPAPKQPTDKASYVTLPGDFVHSGKLSNHHAMHAPWEWRRAVPPPSA